MCCLYILEINPLSIASFAIIFSHSEDCLFILFIVSFAVKKLLSLIVLAISHFSHVHLFVTLWNAACQALLSTGFSRSGYWSTLPCPTPRDLLNPGIEPEFLTSPTLAGKFFATSATWLIYFCFYFHYSRRWVIEDLAAIYVKEHCACFPLKVLQFQILNPFWVCFCV